MEDKNMSKKSNKDWQKKLAELAEWAKTASKEEKEQVSNQVWRQVEKDFGL